MDLGGWGDINIQTIATSLGVEPKMEISVQGVIEGGEVRSKEVREAGQVRSQELLWAFSAQWLGPKSESQELRRQRCHPYVPASFQGSHTSTQVPGEGTDPTPEGKATWERALGVGETVWLYLKNRIF